MEQVEYDTRINMNSSVQIAVDILTALLTGGFLLFFIETMHIESDVKQRYKAIMNPLPARDGTFSTLSCANASCLPAVSMFRR